jgi:hypothetical protein
MEDVLAATVEFCNRSIRLVCKVLVANGASRTTVLLFVESSRLGVDECVGQIANDRHLGHSLE